MTEQKDILLKYLSEQISIEEDLYALIQEQLVELESTDYDDAKKILRQASQLLEKHFTPLNQLLDKLEKIPKSLQLKNNARSIQLAKKSTETCSGYVASILRDDYATLNRITMSNTLLHTIALALDSTELADLSLTHLENLAPLVIEIGDLVPTILAQELCKNSPDINPAIALIALANAKRAWLKVSRE